MTVDQSSESDAARALLQRYARISTATWSDALDEVGIEGVVSGLPRPSGEGRCVGFAMTAHADVGPMGGFALKDFSQDRMIAAAGRTDVLVVDAGGVEVSCMGGIVALSAHNKGIEGVVIDGPCRDIEDIRKVGLWVASRHLTPRTGKRRVRLGGFWRTDHAGRCPGSSGRLGGGRRDGARHRPARPPRCRAGYCRTCEYLGRATGRRRCCG